MTKPAKPPPPKPLRRMGREWRPLSDRAYRCGPWTLSFSEVLSRSVVFLHRERPRVRWMYGGATRRAALSELARLVRAVGRLADG